MFDRYNVEIILIRDMLGTNPSDPAVLDTHIIERQRKLIQEKGGVNSAINKYLDQLPIGQEKGQAEVDRLVDKLEELVGEPLTEKQRDLALKGKLDALKETFKELETKGVTVFYWDKEKKLPCIGDHMIYGFLKAAAEAIGRTKPKKNATMLNSIAYTQSIVNQHVRCEEQFITSDRDILRTSDGRPAYEQRSLRAKTAQGERVSLVKSEVLPAGTCFKFTLKVLKNSPMTEETLHALFAYGELSGLGQWRNAGKGQFKYELSSTKK